jgi:hypothetical protein
MMRPIINWGYPQTGNWPQAGHELGLARLFTYRFRTLGDEIQDTVLFAQGYLKLIIADTNAVTLAQRRRRNYTLIIQISSVGASEIDYVVLVIPAFERNVFTGNVVRIEDQVISCPSADRNSILTERMRYSRRETVDHDMRSHLDHPGGFDWCRLLPLELACTRSRGNAHKKEVLSYPNPILISQLSLNHTFIIE